MKAFSFQTILKNFGKQLSSLASQMPWCNLRFNLGSMSVLSRVNPLFSRRASHFAAMIFAVLAMSMANIGTAWGDTELFSTDFKNDWTNTTLVTNGDITTTTPTYPAEMYFRASGSGKTVKITDNGVTQCGNLSVNNYISGVKLTGINGSITITLTHTYSSKKPTFRYYFVDGATAFSSSVSASYSTSTAPSSNGEPAVITISGIKNTSGVFYFGAASSSYYSIASITVTTPSGGCSATADAGEDKSTTVGVGVAMAATAASSGYTGAWSIKDGSPSTATSQLSSTSSAAATFTPTAAGTYTLVWTVTDDSDGSCSATDEATVTVTAPTHTVTAATDNASYGTAAAASSTVAEGATTTITATPNSGYQFDHWTVSGTGASLSSTTTNPTTLTMGTSDVTVTAYFVEKTCPSSGTLYSAVAVATGGISIAGNTSDLELNTSTHKTTVTGGSMYVTSQQTDSKNLITANGFTMTNNKTFFKIVLDCELAAGDIISIAVGKDGSNARGVWVSPASSRPGSAPACALTAKNASLTPVTYTVTESDEYNGKTVLYIYRATTNTTYFNNINISRPAAPSCTAPTDLVISGEYVHFPGETLTLNVSGDNIAQDATYTWKKGGQVIAGQTTATLTINSCEITDAGNYTCTVSNGDGCEETADYTVKMYSLRGLIDWSADCSFTKVNATTATYSMELTGSSSYEFKVYDGSVYYGNTGGNPTMTSDNCTNWTMQQNEGNNVTLQTTASGTYTFTLDYSDASNLKISVTYPAKKIVYLNTGDWNCSKYAVYSWEGENNSTVLMTKIDDCAGRNIYQAEIEASHSNVIFIGGNASYDVANTWNNVSYQTIDLTYPSDDNVLYEINTTHLFLTPNGNWKTNGARFAAYFFGNGETWVSMTDSNADGIYECEIPTGYSKVIFCRMNPSAATNNWDNKWNQSADLTITKGKNHYTVSEGAWDNGEGTWKTAGAWTALTPNYTVTFDANGYGTAPDAQCVAKNGMATTPTAPTATGYTFGGWYTDQTCTNTYDFNTEVTSDITLYAKWTANKYQITYKDQGGAEFSGTHAADKPTQHTYGTETELKSPTKDGYTFGGWFTTSDCTGSAVTSLGATAYTSDITLYAKWNEEVTLTAIITYTLNVGTSANTTIKNNVSTTDATNITDIDIDQTNDGADGAGASNRTTKLALATGSSAASVDNPDKYELFTFKVACGKKLTPSEVKIKVANVGSTAGGNQNYKAVLSDAYGHSISNTFTGANGDGTVEEFSITNGGGTYFQGNVTLKLWSCKGASGNASAFRMGTPLEIFGEVGAQATPAATITWNTQPADGQVGSADFAYAVSCSDGSAVTVTSANEAVATIEDGKLHYVAAGTTHLVATATDACGDTITQNSNDFTVTAASVDPDPGTGEEKYYYAQAAISNGSLVKGMSNAIIQFFTVTGGVVANSTALSISSTPSAASIYYNSNNLTHEELSKSSNWGSSSTANRYIQGMKFKDATTYTLELGSKTATSIRFYGWCGSSSRKLTIGGVEYTSSSTKNTFFAKDFTKPGNFTGEVSIVCGGDFYGIIVIDITSLPSCTTPVLSNLEDQKVCPGSNVEWTANNTEALQDGETIAYQWTKKGNATILSPTATLTLNDVTEATGGTYVVTATVSADGKASATATKEVTLTVRPATATPNITANANTIYTGNSVTLTATCASNGVGYQWYTCTDAEGNGESAIGGATNATCTLTAGEAGTYYYKVIVTGDGTHSCGTAEKVYTLVVSASNSGETTCGEITGQFTNGAYTFDTDFIIYGVNSGGNLDAGASSSSGNNRCGGSGRYLGKQRFAVTFPVDVVSFSFMGYQSSDRTIENVKTTAELLSENTEYQTIKYTSTVTKENNCQTHVITPETAIPANTFVWVELSNGLNISEICYVPVSNVNCTDPQVIATVDNATVCEDTENVTFTATNYADGATLQWQKKNGNAWENIGATSATYTISPVTTEHAGQYRVIATKEECSRTSEELTLTVLTAPEFNAFANTASVMKGNALTINDVEATNATEYTWYKSADELLDVAADTKVGTTKELLLAASSITEEAEQTFYLFCVASNSCGSVTSNAITVTVTPFVEEECATKGNEGNDHEFGFVNTDCSSDTYGDSKTPVWKTNSRNKYLTYTAPEGKYFATAKVTVAHTGGTKCGYAYSTNGGTTWVVAELGGLSATLTAITIELPANVNAFRISRNLTAQDGEKGSTSGNFYLAEACFTYEDACTPTSVTPTTTSCEYNISENADFEEPIFTVKHGEEVVNDAVLTYTSSNPAIATVDEDGSVTFEGMTGAVTITAAYAGTTIGEIEYCASEGSYTITVLCEDEEPKIIVAAGTNLDGCNNSITLEAKMQDGTTAFTDGTFQWYRDGEAIDGATSASYEVVRAGTYTVSRTYTCTTMSSNSAVVTNENPEPKVERLTPFQYYHVDKDYSNQMKDRHLFAVTSYGTLDGKRYHLTATRNGDALVLSSSTAFFTTQSSDNAVDTVMIDLNELKGKYSANDEIVITCAPINNCNQVSTITSSITIHVIGQTPTLALICSGANGDGTRETDKLVVGGDFLTGYNKADLCQQTGNQTFDPNTEWGFYTLLKEDYIVTPVNGYAQFNKLNYEPFDILLLTDYPKSSKSEAAQKIIDDMAELCDYRPLLSFKTHFQSDKWKDKTTGEYKYTKWVKKGFTTAPVVPKQTATYVNIVCYAHPMFEDIDDINDQYTFHDDDDPNQLVYQVLTGPGHEGKKGIQGFELADADNFVTIGLVHYNAIADSVTHDGHTHISWNAEANDRLLVAMAERQTNIEARMMLFSLNCGAQSLQTEGGRQVILKCLEYLLETDPLKVADCRMTFDNGAGNADFDPNKYEGTGTRGDSLWSTAANWGPDYLVVPGRNNDVRIAAPCIVDGVKTKVSVGDEVQETIQYYPEVLSIHITENGSLTIPANSSLTARSTILRADEKGNVYPTNVADISLGSNADGNASLILNNERGDTKAGVAMYSKAEADTANMSAATSTWQYIGTPHTDVQNAIYNYYDSWLYQYDTNTQGWVVIPKGGPLVPFRGYCITHPERGHTYWMEGTLAATTNQDITIPAKKFVVVANSWTAPIQINELTDDDMEGLTDKSIYFFNTGSDPEGDNTLTANATDEARWAPSTYISVPIHAADYTDKDANIPSMQGFYVVGDNEADGTLHLDYERHVRAKRENVPSGPMHAPARITDTDNEPQVAKFLFRGKRYDDRLIILERPDFTRGYDSGWDGEQWGGNAAAPMSYVVAETRYDAVSAIPEYEGTVIGFRAGEDNIYTIHFDYDGMEEALYLLDTETKIYTRVLKGNSYTFACPDKAEHNRFILTRKAPQIATGTENIATGENAKAVKFIKDDKIFIFVNGILYDATGKMVVR